MSHKPNERLAEKPDVGSWYFACNRLMTPSKYLPMYNKAPGSYHLGTVYINLDFVLSGWLLNAAMRIATTFCVMPNCI